MSKSRTGDRQGLGSAAEAAGGSKKPTGVKNQKVKIWPKLAKFRPKVCARFFALFAKSCEFAEFRAVFFCFAEKLRFLAEKSDDFSREENREKFIEFSRFSRKPRKICDMSQIFRGLRENSQCEFSRKTVRMRAVFFRANFRNRENSRAHYYYLCLSFFFFFFRRRRRKGQKAKMRPLARGSPKPLKKGQRHPSWPVKQLALIGNQVWQQTGLATSRLLIY